jgi:hypothetical protein
LILRRNHVPPRGTERRDQQDDVEAGSSAPDSADAASLIPKMPPIAPIPAGMTVTPVSRFADRGRVVVDRRQVDLREPATSSERVELVVEADQVVVHIAERTCSAR